MRRGDTGSILLLIMSDTTPSYGLTYCLDLIMKRFLLSLLVLCSLTSLALAAEKNTAVLRPGDTVYVRFETEGKKIKFLSASKEQDEQAQVIITFPRELTGIMRTLKVENKFPRDLVYKAEMRTLSPRHQARAKPTPVVAGKVAFDEYPPIVEEIACFDFKLER